MVDFSKLLAEERKKSTTQQPQVTTSAQLLAGVQSGDSQKQVPTVTAPIPPVQQQVEETKQIIDLGISVEELAPASSSGAVVEYPGLVDLQQRIHSLNDALKANHPSMESLLQSIHRNLQKDPELVHMLKEEDVAIIFAGLQKKTQTKIVEETVKSAKSGKNRGLKNIGLEDL